MRTLTAALMDWYRRHRRDLPWRRTSDPYAIWVSEIMLQQTRVDAVIPYYERLLAKFPDVATLAAAPEHELLAVWAGLGYYSRARNMQRAAQEMMRSGGFPSTYDAIRELPGIGDYTAAAVASIAFGQPFAVLDGNVMRVMARLTNDPGDIRSSLTRNRLREGATELLDRRDPGTFNQALMELGATVCTPADPKCLLCPVNDFCEARKDGRERELPVKSRQGDRRFQHATLLIVTKRRSILLWRRPADSVRLAGFWEVPEASMLPDAEIIEHLGEFRHGITNTTYTFSVRRAMVPMKPLGFAWTPLDRLREIPLSTTSRKALACLKEKAFTKISQLFCDLEQVTF